MDHTPLFNLPFVQDADLVADYPAVSEELADTLEALFTIEPWREIGAGGQPPFLHGAANHGGGFDTAAFCKDAFGFVHLKGIITKGSANDVFLLPVGYRPSGYRLYHSTENAASYSEVMIGPVADGNVYINVGANKVSLDGIIFHVA